MRTKFYFLIAVLMISASTLSSQVLNEFRVQTVYSGKTEGGLRKFFMSVETVKDGYWTVISKGSITTGRNLELAEVKSDSTVSGLNFNELLKNQEFHRLYEISLNDFMDRIDAPDQTGINTARNTTDHKIFRDPDTKNIVISVKSGENDKEAIIRVFNTDNSKLLLLNKSLRAFSGNIIEVPTKNLLPGNYIVVVSVSGQTFSETFIQL